MLIVSIPEPGKGVRKYLYGSGLTLTGRRLFYRITEAFVAMLIVSTVGGPLALGGLVFHFWDLIRIANACKNL